MQFVIELLHTKKKQHLLAIVLHNSPFRIFTITRVPAPVLIMTPEINEYENPIDLFEVSLTIGVSRG